MAARVQRLVVSIRSPHGCKGRCIALFIFAFSIIVSIRSPHGCKGRFRRRWLDLNYNEVSIRSPHGCKGRLNCGVDFFPVQRFQSAPLTDVRGDQNEKHNKRESC